MVILVGIQKGRTSCIQRLTSQSPSAGCVGVGLHDLRRLNATPLLVGAVNMKTAQVQLDHSDPRMALAVDASAPASTERSAPDADVLGQTFVGVPTGAQSR